MSEENKKEEIIEAPKVKDYSFLDTYVDGFGLNDEDEEETEEE